MEIDATLDNFSFFESHDAPNHHHGHSIPNHITPHNTPCANKKKKINLITILFANGGQKRKDFNHNLQLFSCKSPY